jgi:hypothetical protein
MRLSTQRTLLLLSLFVVGCFTRVWGQDVTVHGTVYNMYRTKPLDRVSVISASGRGTTTDSNGNYIIVVDLSDSIYFSYLGRATSKFAIRDINYSSGFDIALHVDPVTLQEVKVMPRSYRDDSIQNRKDYEKYFDYKKPGFKITDGSGGLGAGVDIDALIGMLQKDKIRRAKAFQGRLIDEEHDKYVDHRFARSVVLKITHLEGDELDSFMIRYRPSYEFCKKATDYDLYDYIKLAFREYQKDRKDRP